MTAMATILIADDEKTFRDSIQKVLEREGYEVEAVDSVDSALQRLSLRSFNLVISDVRMPGKSGIDLLKELSLRGCPVPVILVSAYADSDTEVAAKAMGASGLLHKPLRRRDLVECAGRAMAGRNCTGAI